MNYWTQSKYGFRYDATNHYHLHWDCNPWPNERMRRPWEKIKITHDWINSTPVKAWVQWCLYSRMVEEGIVFA